MHWRWNTIILYYSIKDIKTIKKKHPIYKNTLKKLGCTNYNSDYMRNINIFYTFLLPNNEYQISTNSSLFKVLKKISQHSLQFNISNRARKVYNMHTKKFHEKILYYNILSTLMKKILCENISLKHKIILELYKKLSKRMILQLIYFKTK